MIKDKIEEKLKTEISSRFVEVINESPNHNVPDGAPSGTLWLGLSLITSTKREDISVFNFSSILSLIIFAKNCLRSLIHLVSLDDFLW